MMPLCFSRRSGGLHSLQKALSTTLTIESRALPGWKGQKTDP
ncbi:hypothetical protein GQ607_001580 [Colletotrichum asianum]|uniref:Uncharacterized protein n=1 Tax=Colletotrichum asianum TaxID=702518 RepID=A0A8H3WSG1_9PEZI|nr:hypothetical protein GQ607_001580 [Colletotrichum asianum]